MGATSLNIPKLENGQPDPDVRQLAFYKNQYGRTDEPVPLRFRDGMFLPETGTQSFSQVVREANADEVFLTLLQRFTREGRNVSYYGGTNYAPGVFETEEEAKKTGATKSQLKAAMQRLFKAGKIINEQYGRPSNPHNRLKAVG
jgi:RecA-family ATPase